MSSSSLSTDLRVDQWPRGKLPLPPFERRPYRLTESGCLLPTGEAPQDYAWTVTTDPAGEVYLELAAVDLDDEPAILAFANRFGVLGVRARDFAALRYVGGFFAQKRHELESAVLRARESEAPRGWNAETLWGESAWAETLTEFRYGARCLRDLTTARRVAEGTLDLDAAVWEAIPPDDSDLEFRDAVGHFLERSLNAGLESFSPHVFVLYTDEVAATPERWSTRGAHAPLYNRLCLELYNHIAEGAVYRRCANETCRQMFVRQRGRAQAGQHRSKGVRFCTKQCAKTVTQRKYRATRKASEGA